MKTLKSILITGCSSGIGYETAKVCALKGHTVYATARNLDSKGIQELKKLTKENNLKMHFYALDVTKQESIDKVLNELNAKGIDVLINNAGYGTLGPIEEFSIQEIKEQYETNILGVLRMYKSTVPIMRKCKNGTIINISSINGLVPFPLFSIYSSSKFALETLTEGMRFELSSFNIKVYLVEPGSFKTDFSKNRKAPQGLNITSSPYKNLINNFQTRYKKTHTQSKMITKVGDPAYVANKILEIIDKTPNKFRHIVGADAYKFYVLRKLLPFSLWEKLLHFVYNW